MEVGRDPGEEEIDYKSVFGHMSEGFALHEIIRDRSGKGVDYRFLAVNEAYARHTGLKPSEIIGKTLREIRQDVDEEQVARYGEIARGGPPMDFEFFSKAFSRHLRVKAFCTKPGTFATVFEDISERKHTERALRESQDRLRVAVEGADCGTWSWDLARGTVAASPRCLQMFGVPAGTEVTSELFMSNVHPDDRDRAETAARRAMEKKAAYSVEMRVVHPGKGIRWILCQGRVYEGAPGEPPQMHGVSLDITRRKRAQELLRDTERRLRLTVEGARLGTWRTDLHAHTFEASKRTRLLHGLPLNGPLTREGARASIHPEDRPRFIEELERTNQSGQMLDTEYRAVSPDGSVRWVRSIARMFTDSGHSQIYGMVSDITDGKLLERRLQQERDMLLTLVNSLPDMVFVKDRQHRFILVNRSLAQMAGVADPGDLVGKTDFDISPPEIAAQYVAADKEVMETARSKINMEERSELTPGASRWMLTTKVPILNESGEVTGIVGVSRDITERKAFEARISQAQKLESLGVLAGGIAHDFNNILTAILLNADIAQQSVPEGSPERDSLWEISRAAQRAADLSQQMLTYTGKGHIHVRPLDLGALVREMQRILHASVARNVELYYHLGEGLPPVPADPAQIRQVIMNLVINAAEAIGEARGKITITTTARECDAAFLTAVSGADQLPPGRYVCLTVADTGSGMEASTQARIFEPFFTTRFTGRGLGLPVVLGIVRSHKGAISVESAPGKGATFMLLFPASSGAALPGPLPDPSPGRWSGHGTLLLVDDEESVRVVAGRMLKSMGFDVLIAADGIQALEAVRAHKGDLACVILDLTMPKMDGLTAYQRMQEIDPGLKVILSSGYGDESALRELASPAPAGFLEKPYRMARLEQKLREVLGQ